jgi:antirestriction protein ArdC
MRNSCWTPKSSATEGYYATLLNEPTHWTKHASRCDRQLDQHFGDAAYAMEEMVAELGAAFLCADLRVANTPRPDHAHYLASWLAVLRQDKRAIFTAASRASEAAAFLNRFMKPAHSIGTKVSDEKRL